MPRVTRRSALELGIFSAGAAMAGLPGRAHAAGAEAASAAGASGGNPEHTWGHTIPFGDEYFENVLPPLESILRTELPVIDDLSSRMASVIKNGGNVWYQAKQGHMPRFEFDESNRGNPGLLRSNSEWDDGEYDKMRAGDVLVTNYVNENVKRARERGVFIVEVTVCYQDSPEHPRGYLVPNPLGLTQADLADAMVESYTPYEQGIVRCAANPRDENLPLFRQLPHRHLLGLPGRGPRQALRRDLDGRRASRRSISRNSSRASAPRILPCERDSSKPPRSPRSASEPERIST